MLRSRTLSAQLSPPTRHQGSRRFGIAALAVILLTGLGITFKSPAASAFTNGKISMIADTNNEYCVDADGNDPNAGGAIIQWSCNGDDPFQQWVGRDRGNDTFALQNRGSSLCLWANTDQKTLSQQPCGDYSDPREQWYPVLYPYTLSGTNAYSTVAYGYDCLTFDSQRQNRSGVTLAPCANNSDRLLDANPDMDQLFRESTWSSGWY